MKGRIMHIPNDYKQTKEITCSKTLDTCALSIVSFLAGEVLLNCVVLYFATQVALNTHQKFSSSLEHDAYGLKTSIHN